VALKFLLVFFGILKPHGRRRFAASGESEDFRPARVKGHPQIEAASCSELVELPGERADMAPDGGAEHEVAVRGADPQEKERESLAEKQRIGANINIKKRAHLLGHRS
jgi:hypothetical protein